MLEHKRKCYGEGKGHQDFRKFGKDSVLKM